MSWRCLVRALMCWHSTVGELLLVPSFFLELAFLVTHLLRTRTLVALGPSMQAVPAGSPTGASLAPCSAPRPSSVPSPTWQPCLRWCCGDSTCGSFLCRFLLYLVKIETLRLSAYEKNLSELCSIVFPKICIANKCLV